MGKSTLVTRGGVRQYTLATRSATLGESILVVRQRCEGAHPIGGHDVSGQKPFGLDSLQGSVTRGALFCPFWWVTSPEHTWSLFAGCPMGRRRCLSRTRHYPLRP